MNILSIKNQLIKQLGQQTINKNIIFIADVLNDLDYYEVLDTLPVKTITQFLLSLLTDKYNKQHYRTVYQIEQAKDRIITAYYTQNGNKRKLHMKRRHWNWKSTSEKLRLLIDILKLKKEHIHWRGKQGINAIMQFDARNFVYNIIANRVNALDIEREIAHKIWYYKK